MTMIQKEEKITILFIGANYNNQKVVRTEKEFRAIKETISRLPYRNQIQLIDSQTNYFGNFLSINHTL